MDIDLKYVEKNEKNRHIFLICLLNRHENFIMFKLLTKIDMTKIVSEKYENF
jgi:ATP-dependent Clp protease ATP-binding subunit ClpA